jgi:hypothetical protein
LAYDFLFRSLPSKIFCMKKLITSLAVTGCIITVLFFSCKKIENNNTPSDAAFIAQAKTWFNSSFVNTAEYKNGTANGNFKAPNWEYGNTYTIGNTQVAEFPLITGRKKVYISETLSEADNRRVIDNTKFKVLFVKVPGKAMEVRIIQYTPAFNYLQSKNFNLSNLSFKDYAKDFKGDFMMFDFDNNFKAGYHFANEGIKTIKLKTKFPAKNNVKKPDGFDASSTSSEGCEDVQPECVYTVHTTYEVVCVGGWNPSEGYNPDYCHINIVSMYCELAYCPGSELEQCINQGNTEEACLCSLYGFCGGGGGEQCDPSLVSPQEEEFNSYKVMANATPVTVDGATSNAGPNPITGTTIWTVAKGLVANWQIKANTQYSYYHYTIFNVPANTVEQSYDLFNYQTVSSYYTGSNTFITSTWTQTSVQDQILNNKTAYTQGKSVVYGTIRHVTNIPLSLPYCGPLALDETNNIDPNTLTFSPR